MAGHSKWANIRHRKERMDSKRGKVFTRLIREIVVAAKVGGTDATANPRLRLALEKAKEANVPGDNLERAIKRGGGQLEGAEYVEARYEGYGPAGAAILVDCLTDNKNRTLPEVRTVFNRYGGNLGGDGSVSYQFRRCGQLLFAPGADEARLMELAAENGADDFQTLDDDSVEILCNSGDFLHLRDALRAADLLPFEAQIIMKAENEIQLPAAEAAKMQKLVDALEDLDDTQEVYTNAVAAEETF